jgi:hypothetical protein
MNRDLPNDVVEFFQETGRRGGKIGGKRSLETMTPEQRSERAKKAAAASAKARSSKERLHSSSEPEASRRPRPMPALAVLRGWRTKKEVLTFADHVLSGLHGYAGKGSRKRRDFYRNDLQWLADVLSRVDAGDDDPLRSTGQ